MKLQSTDWLAEVCTYFVVAGAQVRVVSDSAERAETTAKKVNNLLTQYHTRKFTILPQDFEFCAYLNEFLEHPVAPKMIIRFRSTGELVTWVLDDWVGVYDGRRVDLDFSEQLLDTEASQAYKAVFNLCYKACNHFFLSNCLSRVKSALDVFDSPAAQKYLDFIKKRMNP